MISLIIPVPTRESKYLINLLNNIDELYPDRSKVEIVIVDDKDVSLSTKYNKAVSLSKGEKIIENPHLLILLQLYILQI